MKRRGSVGAIQGEKHLWPFSRPRSPVCVPLPPFYIQLLAQVNKISSESHWLHLFDFSPVCVFKVALPTTALLFEVNKISWGLHLQRHPPHCPILLGHLGQLSLQCQARWGKARRRKGWVRVATFPYIYIYVVGNFGWRRITCWNKECNFATTNATWVCWKIYSPMKSWVRWNQVGDLTTPFTSIISKSLNGHFLKVFIEPINQSLTV